MPHNAAVTREVLLGCLAVPRWADEILAEAEAELGRSGRVLLRPSGTESLVRVMVEAETFDQANDIAHHLADVVKVSLAL